MTDSDFDKKMKKLSKELEIQDEYYQKVDEILDSLPERKPSRKRGRISQIVLCVAVVLCLLVINKSVANANIFETFRQTIMDFLNRGDSKKAEEAGVSSQENHIESKSDLFLELRESVIDSQTIYLLVSITAPSDIAFSEDMTFDYFAFSRGENFNTDQLIGGSRDCRLMETMEGRPNEATYIVSLSTDEELEEGEMVTVFFRDLKKNPYSDNPEMLVEGIWSISFPIAYTVSEKIEIKGTEDMEYAFLGTTARVEKIKMTPLGMKVLSDVSNVPYEDLGVSDTSVTITLQMLDGSEIVVIAKDPEVTDTLVCGGSLFFDQEGEKNYIRATYEFDETINLNQVVGITIEDLFVPVEQVE